jgi:hypothetical protein
LAGCGRKDEVLVGVIPVPKVQQVQFCEAHAPVFTANAVAVGLTSSQCTLFTTLTTAARKAYNDAQTAKQAYHAAVTEQNQRIAAAISGLGGASDLIRFIKTFAENTANPNAVYATAQIPPPAIPQPAPPPGQPTDVTVSLESNGAVTLRWKAVNAAANAGTFFSITRKLSGESEFTLVGNTGAKFFTDDTLVQGTSGAAYIIQGHRGTSNGQPTEQIGVQFGVSGPGIAVTGATVRMAA